MVRSTEVPESTISFGLGLDGQSLSLLWPHGSSTTRAKDGSSSGEFLADLDLSPVVYALSGGDTGRIGFVQDVLAALLVDRELIDYRAATLSDLLAHEGLRDRLQQLLPTLSRLVEVAEPQPWAWSVHQRIRRLQELELYCEAIACLRKALANPSLRSPGLLALRGYLEPIVAAEAFVALRAELPAIRATLQSAQSITVGINLGPDMESRSATILAVGSHRLSAERTFLGQLFGVEAASQALVPLRGQLPGSSAARPALAAGTPAIGGDAPGSPAVLTYETDLAGDLRGLLERLTDPVRRALDRYRNVQTRALCALEPELAFLLQAAAMFGRLRAAGLPICRPAVAPLSERVCVMDECYNVTLALRMLQTGETVAGTLVTNPVTFDASQGQIWILTGPNRGGKTVYARAAAQAQLLCQAGLYAPARAARISPVDAIYTHFPTPERLQPGMGRLDDEAVRLAAIFAQASPHSLIVLNEALAGTNAIEGLILARDVVCGLRLLGARAIFVTHLLDLAGLAEQINLQTPGLARVGSLVSEVEVDRADGSERRTYRIRRGPAQGTSYASTIAEQHGISIGQLASLLCQRGIVPPDCPSPQPFRVRSGASLLIEPGRGRLSEGLISD